MPAQYIQSTSDLDALFGTVSEAAIRKEVNSIHPVYRRWIEASPFAVIATSGASGLDVSPRGDPAPLVRIIDEKTLLLPERRGNNRVDGLRNLLTDPRVSLIFFVPGVNETLRLIGKARICVDADLLQSFAVDGKLPRCVLEIKVDSVFFQCARALIRSSLWDSPTRLGQVPTAGEMLAAVSNDTVGGQAYDAELPERTRKTLY
ncbi:MAG: pyridoxamine 5'-phosphate oxidase family protein [Pirellulales bacterium]